MAIIIINVYAHNNNLIAVTENITNITGDPDIAEADIAERSTTYEYDSSNRLIRTIYWEKSSNHEYLSGQAAAITDCLFPYIL